MTTTNATTSATTSATAASSAAASLDLLDRSRHSLLEACRSQDVTQRYRQAQLGALRAAAAVVAARTTATTQSGPRSLWELLPTVAPELSEWAGFFAVVGDRRDPSDRTGKATGDHTAREADDLLRDAEAFLDLVRRSLGLPASHQHADLLFPTGPVP
jgi:SAV_6107-like HEPN